MATSAAEQAHASFDDYLAAEQTSAVKHEWLDGVVYAMSGASPEHSWLAINIGSILRSAFGEACRVHSSDLAIYIRETGFSTYPDISVICGPLETHRGEHGVGVAATNPTLLVEIFSDSTERYCRSEKFAHYVRIPSLREYVLVSQKEPCIEVYRRPERGRWDYDIARAGETLELHGRTIVVDDVYR